MSEKWNARGRDAAIAQVMGHKPSATAEGYRPRSVDALRPYLAQIEAHILEQAGVVFDAKAAPGALRCAWWADRCLHVQQHTT